MGLDYSGQAFDNYQNVVYLYSSNYLSSHLDCGNFHQLKSAVGNQRMQYLYLIRMMMPMTSQKQRKVATLLIIIK